MKFRFDRCFLLVGIFFQVAAQAVMIHVPHDQPTIQAAVDAASDLDTVLVRSGYYSGPGNRDINPKGKAITIRSDNGSVECMIDCGGSDIEPHRGFVIQSHTNPGLVIKGFTIRNGYMLKGGGIYCESSTPLIADCALINNMATEEGGGIFVYTSTAIITNCSFIQNTSVWGGGLQVNSSSGSVSNCIFKANTGTEGGGVCLTNSTAVLGNCLFYMNDSVHGGAMATELWDNSYIGNCTTSQNTAQLGTGFYGNESTSAIRNCIFWDDPNNEEYCAGVLFATFEHSDVWETSGVLTGDGNINQDPQFTSSSNYEYYLCQTDAGQSTNSPCLNAGCDTAMNTCFSGEESAFCLHSRSTCTNRSGDFGMVDMGYHYTSNYCDALGVEIWMPSYEFCEGEMCSCHVTVCNSYNWPLFGNPLFVILDVHGAYYFAPSFSSYDNYLIQYPGFPTGESIVTVLPQFNWPDIQGSMTGIAWIAGITDPEVTTILGDWDAMNFGWR